MAASTAMSTSAYTDLKLYGLSTLHASSDKMLFFNPKVLIFFLFPHKKICCGYSLESPHRGASDDYPQHMFSWRNKKNIIRIPAFIWRYGPSALGMVFILSI